MYAQCIYHVPKCMSYYGAIGAIGALVISGRAHCLCF